ncbi:MlaE family ABC transporter permease [Luteibaculum oceani]|uniref:MlaE family ABC transporter permease n=1 Tax=Luteibaculum oceani TaxID=1294296 RepID=UPI001CB9AFB6|nr:ABC transporter permease [Luteibaculum oceani]
MALLTHFGSYFMLIKSVFRRPQKARIFFERVLQEVDALGVKSTGIVALLSFFMGAVITLQTATNIDSPLIPLYTVGFATRQSVILEFAPTIISLILAGKVGSNVASEIGTMRVTEQIDALEIMGVNSASFLILPKITAAILINPFLIIMSMFLGIGGGWIVSIGTGIVSSQDYFTGVQLDFKPFTVVYALIKTVAFAFVITSVSSYHGYFTRGGALEVGVSSTKAVVYSSILILILNYVLTQMLLI